MSDLVYCDRCDGRIPADRLDIPNHCLDTRCPMMDYEVRLARAKKLGREVDFFAMLEAAKIERLAKRMSEAAE